VKMGDFLHAYSKRFAKEATPRDWQEKLQNLLTSTESQVCLSSAEREKASLLRSERDAAARRALNESQFALELRQVIFIL
jgi:hypothetical protein